MLSQIMSHAEAAFASRTPEEASLNFFAALEGLGASYLQTRLYRRPSMTLTSASHWAAGGFITRVAPDAWPGSPAFDYVCLECNPLLTAIRESQTRYRFSDFAPRQDRSFDTYWDAMNEANIHDALCATSYAADGVIASLHLGFQERDFAPEESFAIQMAGLVLTERLISLATPPPATDCPRASATAWPLPPRARPIGKSQSSSAYRRRPCDFTSTTHAASWVPSTAHRQWPV